jgi:hypothetical protein
MKRRLLVLIQLMLVFATDNAGAQHEHLNAGASGTLSGSQLRLVGADAFLASSGYLWGTTFELDGYFPGFYATIDLTFAALAATPFRGGPEPGHAAIGSNLQMQVVSVSGPAGGAFGYWETGDYFSNISPTATFNVGSATPVTFTDNFYSSYTNGFWTFAITEAAPSDPWGHVHDRAYSFTTPGNYQIGFRIIDTTAFHTASQTYTLAFNVVPEPAACMLVLAGTAIPILRRRRYRRD